MEAFRPEKLILALVGANVDMGDVAKRDRGEQLWINKELKYVD
jgi:hypothetical protein